MGGQYLAAQSSLRPARGPVESGSSIAAGWDCESGVARDEEHGSAGASLSPAADGTLRHLHPRPLPRGEGAGGEIASRSSPAAGRVITRVTN